MVVNVYFRTSVYFICSLKTFKISILVVKDSCFNLFYLHLVFKFLKHSFLVFEVLESLICYRRCFATQHLLLYRCENVDLLDAFIYTSRSIFFSCLIK